MVATFQNNVQILQGFGVPGELSNAGPMRAESFTINSASAANNIIGNTICTITSQGNVAAGGTGVFAGLLVAPKEVALFGTSGVPLNPTLVVPNYTQIQCATMGSFYVTLPAAANIGDLVVYTTATGRLSTIAPGADLAVGTAFANAVVDYYTVTDAGLAIITMTPTLVIPQPA